jgi:hypothetical protein
VKNRACASAQTLATRPSPISRPLRFAATISRKVGTLIGIERLGGGQDGVDLKICEGQGKPRLGHGGDSLRAIRGGHYGQRPRVPRSKAEHTAAPTNAADVKKVLANSEPSTHGGKADNICSM